MKNRLMAGVAYAAEDGTGGGAPVDTASVLYPDEKPAGADNGDGAKPEDGAPKEGDDKGDDGEGDDKKDADPTDVVPEDGKYVLTMPEGVEVDQELLDDLGPEFKDAGLTSKQAQKLADKFIAKQQARAAAQAEEWNKTVSGWVDTAKKDEEIGGAKWDATAKSASSVVERFGTPELKEYLNASGGGNHPELIRFMARVGAVISEDNPAVSENPGKKVARDTAEILYPHDQPKGK